MTPRVLVIDNYDSFTFNLVQYLGELGAVVEVFQNDAIDVAGIRARAPHGILISPGPCTPNEAGVSLEVLGALGPTLPIFGVCLGHQAIGQAFGGRVVRAGRLMHGKTSPILHDGRGALRGAPVPVRGHALPLAHRRARVPPRVPRGERVDRRGGDHGPAPHGAATSRACSSTPRASSRTRASAWSATG